MTTFPRRTYSGGAKALKLKAPITATAATMTLTGDFTTWPTGTHGHFTVTVTEGFATEEKMTLSAFSHSSGQATISIRGFDGTAAVGHVPQTGTTANQVRLTWSAVEATQANSVAHTVNTIQTVAVTKVPFVRTSGGVKKFTYETPSSVFGLNTTTGKIRAIWGSPSAGLATDTTAAKATHIHLGMNVGYTNHLHGTPGGTAFFLQVASKTVTTTMAGLAQVTLPNAFPNALIAAWVMTYTTGDHVGFLFTVFKTTCTNQRVSVSVSNRGGTSIGTTALHMMVLAVGC